MKKLLLIAVILATLLTMSCEEPEVNPFIGTWESEAQGGAPRSGYTFTENEVTCYYYDNNNNKVIWWSGTYTYNDTHITITMNYGVGLEEGNDPNPVWTYQIENNSLSIGIASNYIKVP